MEEGGKGGFEGETPTVLVATSNNTFPTPFHKNPEHYKLETPVSDRHLKTFSNSNTSILRPLVITAQKVKIKTRVDVQCVMQYIQKFPSDLKPVPKKRMLYMNSPKGSKSSQLTPVRTQVRGRVWPRTNPLNPVALGPAGHPLPSERKGQNF